MVPQILAIADDLTGALETGARLVDQRVQAAVFTRPCEPDGLAAVVNANSRHLAADAATALMLGLLKPAAHLYLKTDSTLRGPIAASIGALLHAFPDRKVLYAPAYPALGRTVERGRLFVDGIPLQQTEFTRELLDPVHEGSIVEMLGRALGPNVVCGGPPERASELLHRPEVRLVVCDGQTGADLDEAAEQIKRETLPVIAVGTAGFVSPWARTLKMERHHRVPLPTARSGIIIAGSRHPRSRAQARYAMEHGIPASWIGAAGSVVDAVNLIQSRRWAILITPDAPCGDPLQMAARCGETVRDILSQTQPDALVVFGGDTAWAITEALACHVAHPYGELLPGVPVSRIGEGRGYMLVTKAGGFAGERVIEDMLKKLEGD